MHAVLPDSLLGTDMGTVGLRLGPPLQCRAVGDEVHLAYLGDDGQHVADGIVLVDGVVVRAKPGMHSLPTLHGYFVGREIERVLPYFGTLLEVTRHLCLQELLFPGFCVCVHEGRVVLALPRTVTRAS